jgi:hypothetical protein
VRVIAALLTTAPVDLIFHEPAYSLGDEQNAVAARVFVVVAAALTRGFGDRRSG